MDTTTTIPIPQIDRILAAFPQTTKLSDGRELQLRVPTAADRDAIVAFARNLPETDLLFLRVDITKPEVVENWLDNVAQYVTVTLLGVIEDRVIGYATVDRNPARWTRRIGEIRVSVAHDLRNHGIGRHLTAKIFDVARQLELRKLVAHMTPDQLGALAAFKRLGFVPEALLADYVEDRDGWMHDLIIMSHDLDGLTDHIARPLSL